MGVFGVGVVNMFGFCSFVLIFVVRAEHTQYQKVLLMSERILSLGFDLSSEHLSIRDEILVFQCCAKHRRNMHF